MISKPDQIESRQQLPDDPEQHPHTISEDLQLSSEPSHELIKKLEIAEKKLSFLGLVVASSAESIVTVDFDGIITTWNASAERLYGYPTNEAVGKPLTMLTLPEDLLEILSNINSIKHGDAVEIYDTVRIQKGGDEIDLEILMSPVTSVDGNVIGVATIARDITERVRLTAEREAFRIAEEERRTSELDAAREHENRLAESQMRLAIELSAAQHLQEVSTQMIGEDDRKALYDKILDASTQIMRAQFASLQILYPERGKGGELRLLRYRGFSPEAAKYWEWVTFDSEAACGQALRTGERVIIPNIEADRQMIGSEDRAVYFKDRILAVQTTPLISRGGRLLGMISTHWNRPHTPTERDFRLLDVLARQAADLIDRSQAEELTRKSEEKYRTLFESIDEGFCLLEVLFDESGEAYDYVFLEANAAFERQSGLMGAVGRSILELVPRLEAQWVKLYGRVAKTGEPIRFEAEVTSMARVFDIYATRSAGNNVAVVFSDISERKRRDADLAFLAVVSADLVQQKEIGGMMEMLGAKIGAHFGATRLGFFELNEAADEAVCEFDWHASLDDTSLVGTHHIADFYTDTDEFARTMRAGEAFVLGDSTADSRLIPESLAALNIRSFVAVPDGGTRPRLTLALYDSKPRDWTKDEINLIRELTARIWTRLERARAESALRESETLYRALVTIGSSTIYRMSPDWREMRQLDGADFVVDLGKPTTDWIQTYLPVEERPRVAEAIERAILTKDVFELEHRVFRVDGTVGWTFSRAIPLLDDAGEIVEWFGAASDITDRVQADQSFTRLFEASPAPFLVLAPNPPQFTITEVNDAYLTATMRRREDLVGRPLFDAFPDNPNEPTINGVSNLRASLERVLSTRQPTALPGLKYDIAWPDGTFEERWWSPVNSPILDENGEVEAIIHNANDVTEERRSEAALRASEKRYRTLFTTIDQGYATTEVIFNERGKPADYVFLEINPAFEELTGLKDAQGRSAREIVPGLAEFWFEMYGKVALTGASVRFEDYAEAMDRWFDVFASRIGGEDSRTVALVFSNITERKRVEEELLRSRESLERRVEERTRELAEMNIALQVENLERRKIEEERVGILQRLVTAQEDVRRRIGRPARPQLGQHVTALRFKLEAAAKILGDNPEVKDQIGQAQEYAKQVDTDVEFLTFELRPTALDDLGLIEAVGIFLKEWSLNHNVAADFYSRPFEETLPSEAEINVYRIVQEALNNTLKHAKAKRVAVHLYVQDGFLVLIVEDDGNGFDHENIAKDTVYGAGLGLIGMRERCLLVGGNLEIESAPGKGTVVFARIPANAENLEN